MQNSTALSADRHMLWNRLAILALGGLLSSVIYLLASKFATGFGFPLDDSWIHLAYARNLAEYGQWAFLPGQPSAASTAPLWTALLAPGFLLKLGPHIWTYFLGITCLVGMGIILEMTVRDQVPTYRPTIPWAGLLMVTEWHFVWAAVSGMETLLFILLELLVIAMLLRRSQNWLGLGVLIGISVWVRPDGITLLIPGAFCAILGLAPIRKKAKSILLLLGGFLALLLPYILVNLALAGRPFPNTFYAKQAEYINWQLSSLSIKIADFGLVFLGGVALIFLPAVIAAAIRSIQNKNWPLLLTLGWAAGYAWMYTSRLPVYQHGRYVMPAMAVYLLAGIIFVAEWSPTVTTKMGRILRFTWLATIAIVSAVFYLYGMTVYTADVVHIEGELVASAKWIAKNVPDGSVVAAHDIGALGYFAPNIHLIDLAGLASPDVVPFITNEEKLARYMTTHKTEFFIAYPFHSPLLAKLGEPIFRAAATKDVPADHEIVIYRWPLQWEPGTGG